MFGADWPFDMAIDDPVNWMHGMSRLTDAEKDAILGGNIVRLLDL